MLPWAETVYVVQIAERFVDLGNGLYCIVAATASDPALYSF